MNKRILPILSTLLLLLVACNNGADVKQPSQVIETTISGLSEDKWTYFSFEKGEAIGQSDFLDDDADAAWALRTDWDFAICGDYLKTNGGTSGSGQGGIFKDESNNFYNITEAPTEGYILDSKGVVK